MKHNGETTLADVVQSIKDLGDRFDSRVGQLETRLDESILKVEARIEKLDTNVNKRLDGVLKLLGGHHRDHERRITALEKSVAAIRKAS